MDTDAAASAAVDARLAPVAPARTVGAAAWRVDRVDGASASVERRASYPLGLLVPVARGAAAWAFLASFGGGLVSGDEVALRVDVGSGASAYLGTQSTGKVFRSVDEGVCLQTLRASVGSGGLLAWNPDPVACYAGARYVQRQVIDLAPGGSAVIVDATASGRPSRGERWAFSELELRTELRGPTGAVAVEALRLAAPTAPSRLGRFDAIATAIAVGPRAAATAASFAQAAAAVAPGSGAALIAAASPLGSGTPGTTIAGCVLRVAAQSTEALAAFMRGALAPLGNELGGQPWLRRP